MVAAIAEMGNEQLSPTNDKDMVNRASAFILCVAPDLPLCLMKLVLSIDHYLKNRTHAHLILTLFTHWRLCIRCQRYLAFLW